MARVILDMVHPRKVLALASITCQLWVCIGSACADAEVRMVKYPFRRCHTLRSARQRRAPLHTPRAGRSLPAQLRVHAQGCQSDDAMRTALQGQLIGATGRRGAGRMFNGADGPQDA